MTYKFSWKLLLFDFFHMIWEGAQATPMSKAYSGSRVSHHMPISISHASDKELINCKGINDLSTAIGSSFTMASNRRIGEHLYKLDY